MVSVGSYHQRNRNVHFGDNGGFGTQEISSLIGDWDQQVNAFLRVDSSFCITN